MVRNVVVQSQNRSDVDDLHISPEIINHDGGRGRGCGGQFEDALELGEVAGEGEGGAEIEWAGLEGPGGEGGDEARGLERVFLVVVLGLRLGVWEVGGDEAERVVLSA